MIITKGRLVNSNEIPEFIDGYKGYVKWINHNNFVKENQGKTLIYFPVNSTQEIKNQAIVNYLDELAENMKKHPGYQVQITGYTDNTSDAQKNSGLFSTAESYGKGTAATEIIIMLLVAFILGYLLRYFLSGKNDTRDYDALLEKYQLLEKKWEACCKDKDKLSLEIESSKNMKNNFSIELDDCNKKNAELTLELEKCLGHNKELSVEIDNFKNNQTLGIANTPVKKDPSIKDDLKKIEGIGPKIEQLLYAEEIYTWDDLAQTEVKVIQTILDNAGPRYKVHNPESWPFQAAMTAKGEWEKLGKWQDEHKGGRF